MYAAIYAAMCAACMLDIMCGMAAVWLRYGCGMAVQGRSTSKVIICPGNVGGNIRNTNWYGALSDELSIRKIECLCDDFPDGFEVMLQR